MLLAMAAVAVLMAVMPARPAGARTPTPAPALTPTPALTTAAPATVAAPGPLAVSGYSVCALDPSGQVECWGDNYGGGLVAYASASELTPTPQDGLGTGVRQLVAGYDFFCALTSTGGVRCWGNDAIGQLGNGGSGIRSYPQDVTGLTSGVTAIGAYNETACALTTVGGVKCWGDNTSKQLGNPSVVHNQSRTPVDVIGLTSGVTALDTNGFYAVLSGGTVDCWGRYGYPVGLHDPAPTAIPGWTNVTQVSGTDPLCALNTSGALSCIGGNQYGGLGDGQAEPYSTTPVTPTGLGSGVASMSMGYLGGCVVTTAGGAKCWGWNAAGEVGGPSPWGYDAFVSTPQDVPGLGSGVARVTKPGSYGDTVCARMTDGRVMCWGVDAGRFGRPPAPDRQRLHHSGGGAVLARGGARLGSRSPRATAGPPRPRSRSRCPTPPTIR